MSKGRVLFYKETTLQPGTYTVDFVSRDLLGGTSGTRTSDLKVASPADNGLFVGDLIVIASTEPIAAEDTSASPLRVGRVIAYPALTPEVARTSTRAIGVLATVRPGQDAAPEAQVEVVQGESVLMASKLAAGRTADGLIQFSGVLPIAELQPSDYMLRLTVSDHRNVVTRSRPLVIKP